MRSPLARLEIPQPVEWQHDLRFGIIENNVDYPRQSLYVLPRRHVIQVKGAMLCSNFRDIASISLALIGWRHYRTVLKKHGRELAKGNKRENN